MAMKQVILTALMLVGIAVPGQAADETEADALVARLNANAEGAIWQHSGLGYFERDHRATLTEAGALEVAFEQCTVWGQNLQGKTLDELMALCGTGHFRWQTTRLVLPLAVADDSKTAIVRGETNTIEVGLRVVFDCSQRMFGCAQLLEGPESKTDFGILCRDWDACGDSAAAVSRLIAIAKSGGL